MNIIFVVNDLSVEAGGVTTIVCGLADALVRRNHRVTVATIDHGGTPATPALATITRLAPDRGGSSLCPSRALQEFLAAHIPDFEIAHIHGIWQRHGHYAGRLARRAGVPYVVSTHGMLDRSSLAMGHRWAKRLAWRLWDGPMIRMAAAVQCSNDAEYRVSPGLHGRPVVVAGNGIPEESLTDMPARGLWREKNAVRIGRPDRPMALFLSRIHPKKGLQRLLPLWPQLLVRQPDLLLVIAGTGEYAHVQQVQSLVWQLGLQRRVLFTGQLVGREKFEALRDADMFVLPTFQEAFSLAVTEAMAAGCPVVITRECNFEEVHACQAGVVIDGGDMGRFIDAVDQLATDPALRRKMGGNGRRLVAERFTWSAIAARMEQAYQAICAGRPIPPELSPGGGMFARGQT